MEVLVRNAHGNLSQKQKDYAAKKLGKLDRYFSSVGKVEIVHTEEKLVHRIEVTLFAEPHIIRGEESDESVVAAIDRVVDKLENRLHRLKGRLIRSGRKRGQTPPPVFIEEEAPEEEAANVIERKLFELQPMSPDEAALQMELVDHPFFIFLNEDSNQTEVLYRRKDGSYGVLAPK